MTDAFRVFYDQARALFPLLPENYELVAMPADDTGIGHVRFSKLNAAGLPIFLYRVGATITKEEVFHECGHAYKALLERAMPWRAFGQEYWDSRGFPGTYGSAKTEADASMRAGRNQEAWQNDPNESWAEAFRIAVSLDAVIPNNEHTMDFGKTINPMGVRAFFRSLAPAAPSPVPPAPTPAVTPPTPTPVKEVAVKTTVVDYYSPRGRDFMDCLALNGIGGIARYLTNSPNDIRQITPNEVADAHGAGLAVHFFYEMNPTYAGYFTEEQGAIDCSQAIARLDELGAPRATVVYFAVDAPTSKIPVTVLDAYFTGIVDYLRDIYGTDKSAWRLTPGLYGFEAHVEHARASYENVRHFAQTYGTPRGELDLWQHEQQALCGVSVDIDDVTVAGWVPSGGPKPSNPSLEEDDMTPEEARAIAVQAIADAGLDPNTVEVIKAALGEDATAIRKLANDETLDDTEVAALTARVDKLRTI